MATVYIVVDEDDKPIYVGCTGRAMLRLEEHSILAPWWQHAASVELVHLPNDWTAREVEALLIADLRPPFNRTKPVVSPGGRGLLERVLAARVVKEAQGPPRAQFNREETC